MSLEQSAIHIQRQERKALNHPINLYLGGLGDVVGSLPKALSKYGHRVMVVSPRYEDFPNVVFTGVKIQFLVFGSLQEVYQCLNLFLVLFKVAYYHEYRDGVDFVFIDHPVYRNRGRQIYAGAPLDVAFRFALLSKATLEAPWNVLCGGYPYGEENLVFISNDWHTALIPIYLRVDMINKPDVQLLCILGALPRLWKAH